LKQFQVWGPLKFNFPVVARLPLLTKCIFPQEFHDSLTADGRLATWNWNKFIQASRDEKGVDDHTLLKRLLAIKDKEGAPLETNYIAVELYDNLIAGQETTAVALVYVAYHMAKQPFWQKKIREELQALPVQEDGSPSLADIDAAPLFDAFIREVYRVNPGSSGRQERYIPDGGKEYNGVHLPQGVGLIEAREAEPPQTLLPRTMHG
jgi:cytochrome P450